MCSCDAFNSFGIFHSWAIIVLLHPIGCACCTFPPWRFVIVDVYYRRIYKVIVIIACTLFSVVQCDSQYAKKSWCHGATFALRCCKSLWHLTKTLQLTSPCQKLEYLKPSFRLCMPFRYHSTLMHVSLRAYTTVFCLLDSGSGDDDNSELACWTENKGDGISTGWQNESRS